MGITGRLIHASASSENKTLIDMSSVANGMYYVRGQSGATLQTTKVVKQ